MKDVISDLQSIIDSYAYLDISQNPPNLGYHAKVNLKEVLQNIDTSNDRAFYEFYRDIRRALNKVGDFQLDIVSKEISFGKGIINFSQYTLCLSFKLHLEKFQNKEVKIYVEEYSECSCFYENDIIEFIKSHKTIYLDKINNFDAFTYIQKFGNDFYGVKNFHAQFSYYIKNSHFFYSNKIPLSQQDIDSITFSFENNNSLTIKYHIIKPENLFNENEKSVINKDEFDIYFSNIKNKNIFDIKIEFLKSKNIFKVDSELKSEMMKWDYEAKSGEFKSRADEQNKLNVLHQNSFEFKDYTDGENVINKCIRLFYSNTYRIVGIESSNLGGQGILAYLLNQLIQPKIDVKYHMTMKKIDLLKNISMLTNIHFQERKLVYHLKVEKISLKKSMMNIEMT